MACDKRRRGPLFQLGRTADPAFLSRVSPTSSSGEYRETQQIARTPYFISRFSLRCQTLCFCLYLWISLSLSLFVRFWFPLPSLPHSMQRTRRVMILMDFVVVSRVPRQRRNIARRRRLVAADPVDLADLVAARCARRHARVAMGAGV